VLQGNYTITFSTTNFANHESISLQSGSVTRWGDLAGNSYDYDITTVDANVGAGVQMIVNGQSLLAGEDFTFDGSGEIDGKFLVYAGHGTDDLTGGAGNDVFHFEGARFGAGDTVHGGGGSDAVVISMGSGVNHVAFGETQFTEIESISVNNKFASDPSQIPSYELVMADGNVAAGATLIVNGQSLAAGQTISVDGSAETDGRYRMFGGAGDDVFIGGANDDQLMGLGGADTFTYLSAADSKVALPDQILEFEVGTDTIDLAGVDANDFVAGNSAFAFIGASAFHLGNVGELRAEYDAGSSVWRIEGETNGDGVADFLIYVTATTADPLTAGDFVL
jgi:Ca2+-binding RTX toxin-like protein